MQYQSSSYVLSFSSTQEAADAAELGFRTIVISDATRGVSLQKGGVDRALVALQEQGVQILLSSELP